MNRRELLLCGLAVPLAVKADCRDENGMIMPDEDDASCLELTIHQKRSIGGQGRIIMTGRALFGFGAYEMLLRHQKERRKYAFKIYGNDYRIAVTRLSVEVNREIGCVVCEVDGSLYESVR